MDDKCALKTKVSEDGLSAKLIVPAGFDRAQLNAALCDATLLRDGIEINPETKKLTQAYLEKAAAAPEGVFEDVIARGTTPTHGKDGFVQWMLDELNQDDSESQDDAAQDAAAGEEPKNVSFYDRSIYTVVKTGDVLGKIHLPTPSYDGRDVTGKNLASREGKPFDFKHDETIIIGKDSLLIAQADGVLSLSNKTASIRDTIDVDEYVDFNTGNIDFNGSVVVRKGVRDCFKVQATGDIEVHGLIEAATIIAGRDLHSTGGFAGREQGVAKVSGSLHAKYLDSVDVHVRGQLCVDREIINCKTRVLGSIDSPRGAIIGGDTCCAGGIVIGELGAEGLPQTTISVGSAPHLAPMMKKLSAINDDLIKRRQRLLNEQKKLQFEPDPYLAQQHAKRLNELVHEIAEVQMQIERTEPALITLKRKSEPTGELDIQVLKTVYPNTVIVYEGMAYRVKNPLQGPLNIGISPKGQLSYRQGNSEPTLLARQADLSDAA